MVSPDVIPGISPDPRMASMLQTLYTATPSLNSLACSLTLCMFKMSAFRTLLGESAIYQVQFQNT